LALRAPSFLGAVPLDKRARGLPVLPGASRYTNPISLYGNRLLGGAKAGFKVLGTKRIALIVGRANVLTAAGFAAYDITSIGLCAAGGGP